MKRSDFFTIAVVATIGVVISAFLVSMLLGDPNAKSVSFKSVDVIDSGLVDPDPEVFNPDAINPTVEVYVGDCVDQDQNGTLDEAELVACGRVDGVPGAVKQQNNDQNNQNTQNNQSDQSNSQNTQNTQNTQTNQNSEQNITNETNEELNNIVQQSEESRVEAI